MKRYVMAVLILFFVFSHQASAAQIRGWIQYQPWLDMYRFDYTWPTGSAWYKVWFLTPTNVYYESIWDFPPTGSHYFNCNGNYNIDFYDANDQLIGYFRNLITTQVKNQVCLSFPEASGYNDIHITSQPSATPGYSDVHWSSYPGASYYEIYSNGQLVDTTTGTSGTYPNGPISVVAKDSNGNTIGQGDSFVPGGYNNDSPSNEMGIGDDETGGPVDPPPGSCGICEKINEALACPGWETVMGELTQAIKNALPTLPEWRQIADQFVDAFDEYFGPVPAAPTKNQIENEIRPDLPELDIDVPGSDMVPILPSDYDTPFVFDVTDAPEIPVVDESEPFDIYEPDQFIDADDPGVFVLPGDPSNHSDGIKNPDTVDTGNNTPGPTGSPTSPPPVDPPIPDPPPGDPNIPPAVMPEPTPTIPDMALPTK